MVAKKIILTGSSSFELSQQLGEPKILLLDDNFKKETRDADNDGLVEVKLSTGSWVNTMSSASGYGTASTFVPTSSTWYEFDGTTFKSQ